MHKQKTTYELPEKTVDALRTICQQHQAELLDYTVRGRVGSLILELFVDNRDGVTLELCQAISSDVEQLLESDPELSTISRLDVSSPGVERPLQFPWQYPKHIGRLLAVHTADGQHFTGYLRSTSDTAITLDCTDDIVTLPYSSISRALVQLEW